MVGHRNHPKGRKRQEEGQGNRKEGARERETVGRTRQEKLGMRDDKDKDLNHGLTGRQRGGAVYV